MKTKVLLLAAALSAPGTCAAALSGAPTLKEAGPNHAIHEIQTAPGRRPRRVFTLATGMNYAVPGGFATAVPEFSRLTTGEFIASRVQHPIRIAPDLNTKGAVTVRTPVGISLYSTPVAVTLSHGSDVLVIGTLTNCSGSIIATNAVAFVNPFAGLCTSIVYEIGPDYFEQTVYLQGRIDPRDYSFPLDETTELSIWTEFYQQEQPATQSVSVLGATTDELVSFGPDFVIGSGQAFTIPTPAEPKGTSAQVRKQYQIIGERKFLVESFPVLSIARGLLSLPDCSEQRLHGASLKKGSRIYAAMPEPPEKSSRKTKKKTATSFAKADLLSRPAVVADYRANLVSGATVLEGNVTYLVGTLTCTSLQIYGGAVVKLKSGGALNVTGPITFLTDKVPAWFTAIDDDAVGESMSGFDPAYTGNINPAGYGNPALGVPTGTVVENCRFRYAQKAVANSTSTSTFTLTVNNSQMIDNIRGIYVSGAGATSASAEANNLLIANSTYPLTLPGSSSAGAYTLANCTFDRAGQVLPAAWPHLTAYNCIFASITNSSPTTNATLNGSNNGFYNTPQSFGTAQKIVSQSPFQAAGAGWYYLTDESGFRNAGTTSGPPASALDAIKKRTTYPPVIISYVTVPSWQSFIPQAQRDSDDPDLGAHYEPLDYLMSGVAAGSNTTFTVSPGTVIGAFGTNIMTYGLGVCPGGTLICKGSAAAPCRIVEYSAIQEHPGGQYKKPSYALVAELQAAPGEMSFRFTEFAVLAEDTAHLCSFYTPVTLHDSEFHGGWLMLYPYTTCITNCLFERVTADIENYDTGAPVVRNCTFIGGSFDFLPMGANNAVVKDNLFDKTSIPYDLTGLGYDGGYNAFIAGCDRLKPTNSTDIVLASSPAYDKFGPNDYYLPADSQLIDAGSAANAGTLGFYHFTTVTNQTKEASSRVDIGFHRVALDSNGNPSDADADGRIDVDEDTNGNGQLNSGETDWQDPYDAGLKIWITQPKRNSNMP